MSDGIRIDKWLWTVRLYKTRSQATEACRSGKVKILAHAVKPSREIKPDEIITLSFPPIVKTIKVIGLTDKRLSAKWVPGFMEDLTPEDEYQKLKLVHDQNFEFRPRGIGRPTKHERREIALLKKFLDV
ncbi:MAG: RNA-binding S4 domain-containing protein [Bacteroidales bacterium]|jgi:ribosome-associated heat shock protein Hsp15|nr:RNA-binding S4 domain-containing protein [Bacteroidales bacterium]